MKIREYEPNDAQIIAQLFADTIREVNAKHYSQKQLDAWASPDKDASFFHNKLSTSRSFVAVDGSEIVGFADLVPERRLLFFFYVHKGYQRKGIGKALLEQIEKTAREQGLEEIYTDASITAKPFFEAMGFVPLEKQNVVHSGLQFVNYKMRKKLETPES